MNDDRCPQAAFTEDLENSIKAWVESGDQVVLGIDANEDIRKGKFRDAMNRAGLVEIISHLHGEDLPRTQNRGSKPIDGIWVSPSLVACQAGYLPFEFDHRAMWIDIPHELAFGHNPPPIVKPAARRLKCHDPRIVKCYLDLYRDF